MSEFRVHHQVSELIRTLGLPGSAGPELYVDLLQKNRTPYVTTQVSAHNAKRKIAEFTRTPVEFLQKYDELKSKNNRDLDAFVYLLSKLSEDQDTVSVLRQNAQALQMPMDTVVLPPSGSKMSDQEVSELRNQLLSVASSGASSQASEVFKKMMREKQSKKNLSFKLPELSSWVLERPNLTGDFVSSPGASQPGVALGTLPLGVQELAIVQDLLMVMTGTEGKYTLLRPPQDQSSGRTFVVDQSLDVSLREVANRILPVCTMYSAVVRFIEDKSSFEYGMVNHALCGAMKTLIKEYCILTAQLEHQFRQGQLPLQRFWFYIQPCKQTMEILASIAQSIDRGASTGGAVLSLLHERTVTLIGDTRAQNLCLFLTQSACAPYFEILEKWIYKGIIKDPYCEFMIEEHEALRKEKLQQEYNDAYWEQHYTVCRDRIPVFLELVADKILRTGKYLNVIRECGRDPKCPHAEEILYTLKERQYNEHIERAYQYASKVLLDHFIDDRELMPRLRSIKRYFLLEQGDFFVHLMDITTEEMKKQVDEIIPSRLESLLELALRTSQAKSDTFKDDLRVALLPYDLITQLLRIISIESRVEKSIIQETEPTDVHICCLEAFSFDYVVRWPESLILSRKALTRYQILFRHLFYCKHVERTLCNLWVLNKAAKQYTLHSSRWYASAFALRQRMLHLVQNLQYYMMFEVIEPNWQIMEAKLRQVSTIDDVLDIHTDFLNMCLKDCMLTGPELLKIVGKLMLVCTKFANCIQQMTEAMNTEGEASFRVETTRGKEKDKSESRKYKTAAKAASERADLPMDGEELAGAIANFDGNFSALLVGLLDQLSLFGTTDCEHNMTNIIHRLDFNGFYTEGLERVAAERRRLEYEGEGQEQGYQPKNSTPVTDPASKEIQSHERDLKMKTMTSSDKIVYKTRVR